MVLITDKDIIDVESKLSLKFDGGSKEFIKCTTNKDIQACPGAGKTTALVAKLDILANKMPFPDKRGILVLTHTNVAVEEVKRKLGYNTNKILGHPNHIGTFQSFVNKYLAIPRYVKYFGKRPSTIDSSLFEKKLISLLEKYSVGKWLLARSQENLLNIEEFLDSLEIYEDKIVLELGSKKKTMVNSTRPFYAKLKNFLEFDPTTQVMAKGYLTYDHCYQLAEEYLREIPSIANIISARFKYVFVDESQDTDLRQFTLLKTIFDNSDSIVQKIGDNDQAIFNFGNLDDLTWEIDRDHIRINDTKRLSPKICTAARNFSITDYLLQSNSTVDINPIIIVFDDDKINQVLPKFAEMIKKYNLNLENQPYFKAIGSIGKTHSKYHTLPSYITPHLVRSPQTVITNDLRVKINQSFNKVSPNIVNNIYWSLIILYLDTVDIKYENRSYTKNTLFYYLRVNNNNLLSELKAKSFQMIKEISDQTNLTLIIESSLQLLAGFMSFSYDATKLDILISDYKILNSKNVSNMVTFQVGDTPIDIHISTIHKAKGETHTATLVLETFNNGYDLNQLLGLLMDKKIKKFLGKKKVIYVGMTRPTHLLCLAIHKSYLKSSNNRVTLGQNEFDQIKSRGYEIIELS